MVDTPKYANVDAEARRFLGGPEVASVVTALALVVHSPVMRVVGSFFVRLSGAPYPMRVCDSEGEAIDWARAHVRR